MKCVVSNQDTLKKQGLARRDSYGRLNNTIVNINEYQDEGTYDDVINLGSGHKSATAREIDDIIRAKKQRSKNFAHYQEAEGMLLHNITDQIYYETYRIINNIDDKANGLVVNNKVDSKYLTNDDQANKIIQIVSDDNKEILDVIGEGAKKAALINKNNNDVVTNANATSVTSSSTTNNLPPPIISDDKVEVDVKPAETKATDKILDELNKIPLTEYERLRKEISDYEKSYINTLAIGANSPLSVSDAVKVNLYKKWYLSNDELFEGRRLQDKQLNDLIFQYEEKLRKVKLLGAQKEILEFNEGLDKQVKVNQEHQKELDQKLVVINKTNNELSTDNTNLKGEIKDLEGQLKANLEKQKLADAIRKSLIDKVYNQNINNNNAFGQNAIGNSGISLSQVKNDAIEQAKYDQLLAANNSQNVSNFEFHDSKFKDATSLNDASHLFNSNKNNNINVSNFNQINSDLNSSSNLTENKTINSNLDSKLEASIINNNSLSNEFNSKNTTDYSTINNQQLNNQNLSEINYGGQLIVGPKQPFTQSYTIDSSANRLNQIADGTINSVMPTQNEQSLNQALHAKNNNVSYMQNINNVDRINPNLTRPNISNRQQILNSFKNENISELDIAAKAKRDSLFQSFNPNVNASMVVDVHTRTININNGNNEQKVSLAEALKKKRNNNFSPF